MASTAVIYQSSIGGHVRTVSEYIANELGADVFDLKKQSDIELGSFDRVIVGTGVHAGRPYGKVVSFLGGNAEALHEKKVSLFVCCMYKDDKGASQASKIGNELKVTDVTSFPDSAAKDSDGVSKDVKAFVERMRQ